MSDETHYLFLASAVAGRKVSVHVSAGAESLASSDGSSIILPSVSLRSGREAWPDVVAQAALIGAESLQPRLLRKLVGRREATRRYGYLELLRAAKLLSGRLPTAFLQLPELQGIEAPTKTADDSLAWALGRGFLPESPAYFGCVRPLMSLRKAVSDEGFAALTRKQAQGEFERVRVDEVDDDEDTEESKILKLFSNPLVGANPLSKMLNDILGAKSSRGDREKNANEGGGAEMPVGRVERALRRGIHAVLAKLPFELPEIDTMVEPAVLAYPEWDVHAQKYKPDWVLIEEVDPWRPEGPRDLDDVLKPASQRLRRQLAQLGLDHEMHRAQPEGSEFDVGRMIDAAIDLATGQSPTRLDIYRASRRTRRDLAVAVALDISGSTGERDGESASVFDRQLQVAYQLGRTLSELGDTVALFGFHSWGRKLVRAVRLKGAEERWSGRIAERLAQIEPLGYTRTGAAIRHGERLLRGTMRLPNRLLVLVTDGIAYDQDYEDGYAMGDARKALEEVRASGSACVCLCIGGSVHADKLRELFGAANLLMVDEPEEVVGQIRSLCRTALASVSRRKFRRQGSAEIPA